MERLNALNLGWQYAALVATGAVIGALWQTARCINDWARESRDIRRPQSYANHPARRKETPQP